MLPKGMITLEATAGELKTRTLTNLYRPGTATVR